MKYLKEQIITNIKVGEIAKFLILSAVVVFLPFVYHQQLVTGPIVNAILILTLYLVGIRAALVLCLIPSLMALSGGLLPAILAPVVPFIMISNVILIICIDWFAKIFRNENYGFFTGLITGATLKFLFLFLSVGFIGKLLINQGLTLKVAQMMSWPQFMTALIGGFLAWIIIRNLKLKS